MISGYKAIIQCDYKGCLETVEVPAEGVDDYDYTHISVDDPPDTWLKAGEKAYCPTHLAEEYQKIVLRRQKAAERYRASKSKNPAFTEWNAYLEALANSISLRPPQHGLISRESLKSLAEDEA